MSVEARGDQAVKNSDLLVLADETVESQGGLSHAPRAAGRASAVAVCMGARQAIAAWGRPAAEMPIVDELREVAYDEAPADPEALVAVLRRLVGRERRGRQHIRLALPATWFEVGIVEMPPVGPVDAGDLIERDLRRRAWLREGLLAWRAVPLGMFEGQAGYLVAAMPAARLEALKRATSGAGFNVELVAPPQLATLEVLRRFLGSDQPADGAAALLHFHDSHVTLAVLHEGRPVQLRTLPFNTANLAGGVADGLIAELRRSALFFKQRSHGRTLDTLFVAGLERERRDVLRDVLRDRVGLEAQDVVCPGVQWPDPKAVPPQRVVLVGLLQGRPVGVGTRIDLSSSRRRLLPAGLVLAVGLLALLLLGGAFIARVRLQSSADRGGKMCEALAGRCEKASREAGAVDRLRERLTTLVGGWRTVKALHRADVDPAVLAGRVMAGLDANIVLERIVVDQGLVGGSDQLELLLQEEAKLVSRCTLDGQAEGESYEAHSAIRHTVDRLKRMGAGTVSQSLEGTDGWEAKGPVRFQLRSTIEGGLR